MFQREKLNKKIKLASPSSIAINVSNRKIKQKNKTCLSIFFLLFLTSTSTGGGEVVVEVAEQGVCILTRTKHLDVFFLNHDKNVREATNYMFGKERKRFPVVHVFIVGGLTKQRSASY